MEDFTQWHDYITATSEWGSNTDWWHIDERMPWIRTPSFLQTNHREDGLQRHLLRAVPYTGPKIMESPVIYPGEHHQYEYYSPVVEYMAQFYPFQTIRVVKDWGNSTAMLIYHLGNNYRLDARCAVIKREGYVRAHNGYLSLNLLYRETKKSFGVRNNGAEELIKFVRQLEQMPHGPRALIYTPHGKDDWELYGDPLSVLNIEKPHTTAQLKKLWRRKLGGVRSRKPCPMGWDNIWLAERYRPKDMIPLEELNPNNVIPEFEEIISER
jgi:hypothetical protein